MEEKQAYPSLSFFKVLLDSSASKISIPPIFIRRFGERLMGNCKLEANGEWHNVKCEKIDTKYYFTKGWRSFVKANALESGYFLVFDSNQETSRFSVSMFDSSQYSYKPHGPGSIPASDNRARVKDEPLECFNEQHLPASVPASNKLRRVKEEPSLIRSRSETAKRYTKREIDEDDDDSRCRKWSSLSFSANFKRHSWVAIPKDFAEKTGIVNHRQVMLVDITGKRWPIDLKPIKGGKMKLTNGWADFKRALRVDPNVTCMFEFKERCSNVLKVRVRRSRGRPHKQ